MSRTRRMLVAGITVLSVLGVGGVAQAAASD